MATILIGADLVPTKSNFQLFRNGEVSELIGVELEEKINKANYTIFNLEVPLVDNQSPIPKCGPCLMATVDTIKGIKKINPHFFTLANNHILDQGENGLRSTIRTLKDAGIEYAGAGDNIAEASHGFIKIIDGIKFGIYCCAEHEFSIATEKTSGANPFDPLESLDHISKLKIDCDFVIVLYHGGKEYYRYPSPMLQKICRKIAEKGGDLVICQHSHCIGCEENWNNSKIVYGQGNFLFDNSDSEFWQTSLLVELEVNKRKEKIVTNVSYIPLTKKGNLVRIAEKEKADVILSEFKNRSEQLIQTNFIADKYEEFSRRMIWGYLNAFSGRRSNALFFKVLMKLSDHKIFKILLDRRFRRINKLALQNFVECEAHRELLIRGLKSITK